MTFLPCFLALDQAESLEKGSFYRVVFTKGREFPFLFFGGGVQDQVQVHCGEWFSCGKWWKGWGEGRWGGGKQQRNRQVNAHAFVRTTLYQTTLLSFLDLSPERIKRNHGKSCEILSVFVCLQMPVSLVWWWMPDSSFKASTLGITWCDVGLPNLGFEVAEGFSHFGKIEWGFLEGGGFQIADLSSNPTSQ